MFLVSSTWQTIADFFAVDPTLVGQPQMLARYVIQVFLLCGSAFFSGLETALFSLSHWDLNHLRRRRLVEEASDRAIAKVRVERDGLG